MPQYRPNPSATPNVQNGYAPLDSGLHVPLANLSGITLAQLQPGLALAGTVAANAHGSTATTSPTGSYGVIQVDGTSSLHGGATIDNTGVNGNGIKAGTAGTYLIIASVGWTVAAGTWIQVAFGLNGVASVVGSFAGGSVQSGGTVADLATLGAADVVNLMAQSQTNAVATTPSMNRLILVRIF